MFVDQEKPTINSKKNREENKILEERSEEVWNAAEGAIKEDAEIVIDMKWPLKLQEVKIINGVGDFSTKSFTVFGSQYSRGPWSWLYNGELEEGRAEV